MDTVIHMAVGKERKRGVFVGQIGVRKLRLLQLFALIVRTYHVFVQKPIIKAWKR